MTTFNSKMPFRHGAGPSNGNMVSFKPGVINPSEMAAFVGTGGSEGINNVGVVHEPVPGFKRDTGLAAEWSLEEHAILREGLVRYADEPNMLKYIKMAAMLRDKTVRDVALKCRWMTKKEHGKHRKPLFSGKMLKDSKEKMANSYSKANISTVPSVKTDPYSLMTHGVDYNDRFSCEAPALDAPCQNLMDENAHVFGLIVANLATLKIQDNVDLFHLTRHNITAILHSMSKMPGIMSLMPPLPVSLDEKRFSALPGPSQVFLFGAPSSIR